MNKTLGQQIYSLRKQNRMTQKELASLLYVSDKAISRWEKDITQPDIHTLKEIANVFNTTIDQLMTIEEDTNVQSNLVNIDLTSLTLDELKSKIDEFIKTNHKLPFKSESAKRKPDYSLFEHLMKFGSPINAKLESSTNFKLCNIVNSYITKQIVEEELLEIRANTNDKNTIKAINHILNNSSISEKWKYFKNTLNTFTNKDAYKINWLKEYEEGKHSSTGFAALLECHPFFSLDFHRLTAHMSTKETANHLKEYYPEYLDEWLDYQEFAKNEIDTFFNELYK